MTAVKGRQFLSYQEQIDKLKKEKGLTMNDPEAFKQALERIGYYNLIGGYKLPFIDPSTRVYLRTTSEDILALHDLDERLSLESYGSIRKIEITMRQIISYCFCLAYGDSQSAYLKLSNYRCASKNDVKVISRLTNNLANVITNNTTHPYIVYQRSMHNNVPLWVAMKTLSFGQLSTFYSFLHSSVQSKIIKYFHRIKEDDLEQYLKGLTAWRNATAHGEPLYSFRIQLDFPDTELHKSMEIPKKGKQYVRGKRDFFGLMISFRYLLSDEDFRKFVLTVESLLKGYFAKSQRLGNKIFDYLGLPMNWMDILIAPY